MLLSKRQSLLAVLATCMLLVACQFTPVYAPDGAASKLFGRIAIPEPITKDLYLLTRRLETRLGRADPAPLTLTISVSHGASGLGTTATGGTTRYHRTGTLYFTLSATDTETKIDKGTVSNFVAYSATSNTAATLAAERDSTERLMIVLADQLIDRLHLIDPALLP